MKRYNLEFSNEAYEQLQNMAISQQTTKKGIICSALVLYLLATREKNQGNYLMICKDGKPIKEIVGY